MRRFEGGCENFRCDFHYNAHENKIEVTYSFTSTIPSYNGTVVVGEPHANTLRYGRKQKGLKPAIDSIFDNPAKAAEIAGRAQELFDHELGWAIARTVQQLAHEVLFRCGVDFEESPRRMADMLVSAHRKEIGQQLGVRRGRSRLFRDKAQYEGTLSDARARILARGLRVTQEAVAETFAEMSARFSNCDDRMIRQWNNEFGLDWPSFVRGAVRRRK